LLGGWPKGPADHSGVWGEGKIRETLGGAGSLRKEGLRKRGLGLRVLRPKYTLEIQAIEAGGA